MGDLVRISATGAGIPYFPEFVARALGFYEALNLDVIVDVFGNGPVVPRNIAAGTGDIGLGGIWLPMLYRGRVESFYPFAQLCDPYRRSPGTPADGELLLVRPCGQDRPVHGRRPNTYTILHGILRRNGVDGSSVRLVADFVNEEASNLFRGNLWRFLHPPATGAVVDAAADRRRLGLPVKEVSEIGQIPWSIAIRN